MFNVAAVMSININSTAILYDAGLVNKETILNTTKAFGKKTFTFKTNLKNRTWIRVEVWDIAANGAFTQSVWIKK